MWGRDWLNSVKLFPPSENQIRRIIKQITIGLKEIYQFIWPVAHRHNLILFSVCPSFIFFDQSMKNIKLSFWWYDLLSPEFVNPDPAKYFFVGSFYILFIIFLFLYPLLLLLLLLLLFKLFFELIKLFKLFKLLFIVLFKLFKFKLLFILLFILLLLLLLLFNN